MKSAFDNPNHPIWLIALLCAVAVVAFLFLAFGYQNGIAVADIKTILGLVFTVALFEGGKRVVTNPLPGLTTDQLPSEEETEK